MQMTEFEIYQNYKESANPKQQIGVLSELNLCSRKKISEIVDKKAREEAIKLIMDGTAKAKTAATVRKSLAWVNEIAAEVRRTAPQKPIEEKLAEEPIQAKPTNPIVQEKQPVPVPDKPINFVDKMGYLIGALQNSYNERIGKLPRFISANASETGVMLKYEADGRTLVLSLREEKTAL